MCTQLKFSERHIDPTDEKGKDYFERFDIDIAGRIEEGAMKEPSLVKMLSIVADHNVECPYGYEINLLTTLEQAQEMLLPNLARINASEALDVGVAYATCHMFDEEGLTHFEEHLLTLLPVLPDDNINWLLTAFAHAGEGSVDGFYQAIERFLAPKLGRGVVDRTLLMTLLRSFKMAERLGFDPRRIFLRA